MYIVIQIRRPLTIIRNPHHAIASMCFNDYHHNRLQLFDDITRAQAHIEEQRRENAQLQFLMLTFQREFTRNLLMDALRHRNHEAMKHAIELMILFNSLSPEPQPFNHRSMHVRNDNPVMAAVPANQRKRKAPDEFSFTAANDVPANFPLAKSVLENLKNDKYLDPISQEEVAVKGTQFACVPIKDASNKVTNYHIYKTEDLIQHINTMGARNNRKTVFKDINTGQDVRTSDVFTLTGDQLFNHFVGQQSKARRTF